MGRKIEVVPYGPSWPTAFELESARVSSVFESVLESIHHIGSTSVPGLSAKPVVDILVVVRPGTDIVDYDGEMAELLYTPRGECLEAGGTPGRFYYSRTIDGVRTHQVHVCAEGHSQIEELLLFPRYLREHPEVADAYGRLKVSAIAEGATDTALYMAGKHDWIRSTDSAHYVLVAEMGSRPVGYLAAQVQRRRANAFSEGHDRLYVHQVSVDPQFRRRGVGRALFAEIERTARSESLTEVALDTWAFNQGAQRFFEALGFSVFNVRMWKRGIST